MKEKIKELLKKIGIGGVVVGGLGAGLIFSILEIIFIWGAGLTMVGWGISLLLGGFIWQGLLILFIGTPIVIGIASFLFPFWVMLIFITIVIWLIRWIF